MVNNPVSKRNNITLALILALAGLAFCAANAMEWLETLCFTEGCRLTQDAKLLGLSLWWYGAGCFAAIGILAIVKQFRLAFLLSSIALAADIFFLAWLALAAPCFSCILGGFFFLAVFFALYRIGSPLNQWPKILAVLWFLVLSPSVFSTLQEAAPPWPLFGNPSAPIKVFFAPTCPACHRTLEYFMPDIGGGVAVYPISRNEADYKKILVMRQALEKGSRFQDAYMISQAKEEPDKKPGTVERWRLNWRLWRNKVFLIRSGVKSIPTVIMQGGPVGGRQ